MPSVDNRVVEMRFDNKDFESDVSESISSLDKLKRALNFKNSGDGFEELGKSAEATTSKVDGLRVITEQLFRNIGNEIYQLKNQFIGLVKSMSTDQIAAGMNKYEQKTSSVQTILNATGLTLDEVNEKLERLMTYSDETSFGFTDMTAALQTMTASGGDLDTLVPMLMGIGNATAYAGKGAAEFSRVMYNLNQAYSLGYLGTMDWRSIEGAGVASKQLKQTLLNVARELGRGDYAMEQFSEALTKKVFDKEVMEESFRRFAEVTLEAERLVNEERFETFSEAYDYLEKTNFADLYDGVAFKAARAAQEAKTFREAIDATKDAVSSGWMETFELIIGDYEEAKRNFTWLANELWKVFASGAETRNDIIRLWKAGGGYEKLWESIRNFWDGFMGIRSRIKDVFSEIFPGLTPERLLDLTDKFYNFSVRFKERFGVIEEALDSVSDAGERMAETFKNKLGLSLVNSAPGEIVDDIGELADEADEYTMRLARTLEALDELEAAVWAGEYGTGEERRRLLEEQGYSYELVQNAVNETAGSAFRFAIAEGDLATAMAIVNGEYEGQVDNLGAIKKGLHQTNGEGSDTVGWLSDLTDILNGVKSAVELVVEAAKLLYKYIITPVWNFLVKAFKSLLHVLAPFSRAFTNFVNKLKESKTVSKNIEKFISWLKDLWIYLKEQENFKKFLGYIGEFKQNLSTIKDSWLERITNFFDKFVEWDIQLPDIEGIAQWFDDMIGHINPVIEQLKEFDGLWEKIKSFFSNLDLSSVTNFGTSLAHGIGEFFRTFSSDKELQEATSGFFKTLWNQLVQDLSEIDLNEVLSTIFKAGSTAILFRLGWSISGFFTNTNNIISGSVGIFEKLGSILNSFSRMINATTFLEIAIGIGILTAAIFALSKIDSEKLANISVDLSLLIGTIALLVKVIGGLFKGDKIRQAFKNFGTISFINIKLSKLGTLLLGLGFALAGLALAVKVISNVQKENHNLFGVFLFITGIITIVGALAFALNAMNVNGNKMLKLSGAFAIFAIGMDILLGAIYGISNLAANLYSNKIGVALWSAFSIIILIMVGFGAMMAIANKVQHPVAIAFGFLIMAAAMNIMVAALIPLSESITSENWWHILVGVGAIAAVILAMGIAVNMINKNSYHTSKTSTGIKTLYALAVGIAAIGAVLWALKGQKFKDLIGPVGAIAILVTVLAGIAVVIGLVAGHVPLLAVGFALFAAILLSFGAALALAGVGALAFAKALDILADNSADLKKVGRNLAQGVIAFIDELNKNWDTIATFINSVIEEVIGLLILKKSSIVDTGAGIVKAVGDKVIKLIEGSSGPIILALLVLLGVLMDQFDKDIPSIVEYIVLILAKIVNGVAGALNDHGGLLVRAVFNLAKALIGTLVFGLNDAINAAVERGGAAAIILKLFSASAFQEYGKRQGFSVGDIFSDDGADAVFEVNAINIMKGNTANSISDLNDELDKEISVTRAHLSESREGLRLIASDVETSFLDIKEAILSAEDSVDINGITIIGDRLRRLKMAIKAGALNENTIGDYIPELLKQEAEAASSGTNILSSIVDDVTDNGSWTAHDILSHFDSREDALSALGPWILGSEEGFNEGLERLGEDGMYALLNGLTSDELARNGATDWLSTDMINTLLDNWDSHSPSRVMIALGNDVFEGFIIGLNGKRESARMTALSICSSLFNIIKSKAMEFGRVVYEELPEKIQTRTIEAFNAVVARISEAIDGNFDMTPVIRPVLDLSEIQNGGARIGSILGMNQYAFNPNLGYSMVRANNIVASAGTVGLNNTNMTEMLDSMRKEMTVLENENRTMLNYMSRYMPYIPELANMKVTLDKNKLVGELAPAIDSRLGDRARLVRG